MGRGVRPQSVSDSILCPTHYVIAIIHITVKKWVNNMQFNRCRGGVQVSIQRQNTVEMSLDVFNKKEFWKRKKKL